MRKQVPVNAFFTKHHTAATTDVHSMNMKTKYIIIMIHLQKIYSADNLQTQQLFSRSQYKEGAAINELYFKGNLSTTNQLSRNSRQVITCVGTTCNQLFIEVVDN